MKIDFRKAEVPGATPGLFHFQDPLQMYGTEMLSK